MIKEIIIAMGLFAALNVHAQDTQTYTPGMSEEGIVYYLPKTRIEIKVTATRVTYTPGELCQYANRYLRIQGVSSQPKVHWELKTVEVNPIGVPDARNVYSVKLKDKSVAAQMELTEDGIIKAINTTSPKEKTSKPATTQATESRRIDPRTFMTEEILLAGSTNKMAELIAKEIYSIRDSKNSLNRGQADYMPQDGSALKIMLDNLNEQEKAMTEMFIGFTEQTDKTFTFYIEPDKEITDQIIFRFSGKLGVLTNDNLAGAPVSISVTNTNQLPPANENEEIKSKKKPDGIIYNIPGKALVTVKGMNKHYYEQEISVTQFGETEILTNGLFNKKVNTRVIFNPVTGGIVKIDKD